MRSIILLHRLPTGNGLLHTHIGYVRPLRRVHAYLGRLRLAFFGSRVRRKTRRMTRIQVGARYEATT